MYMYVAVKEEAMTRFPSETVVYSQPGEAIERAGDGAGTNPSQDKAVWLYTLDVDTDDLVWETDISATINYATYVKKTQYISSWHEATGRDANYDTEDDVDEAGEQMAVAMEAFRQDKPSRTWKEFRALASEDKSEWKRDPKGRFKSIKAVFTDYLKHITFDRKFAQKVMEHVYAFETKSEDNIKFLGSNLVGVYKFRYAPSIDDRLWIEEILGVDDWSALVDDYHDQREVNPGWEVTGSALNMSYVYLAHRFLTNPKLSDKDKQYASQAVWRMMHNKFLSSLMSRSYKYAAQESVAMALYESLSKKSLLKKYHTWGGVINHRAEVMSSKACVHHKAFMDFAPDDRILYAVADTQTRIRKLVVKINILYHDLLKKETRVMSQSSYVSREGEITIREYVDDSDTLVRLMDRVIADPIDLVKDDLLDQTLAMVPTVQMKHVKVLLAFISEHHEDTKYFDIHQMVKKMILYITDYYRENGKTGDTMIHLVVNLRNMFRSSQVTNADILYVRDEMEHILSRSPIAHKSSSTTAPARIAVLVYLALRILTYKHYT